MKRIREIIAGILKTQGRESRLFHLPRRWSNTELLKFAHLFDGKILNVSAWRDDDKQGNRYRNYFVNASEYWMSNVGGCRGSGGLENEIHLNIEEDLPENLCETFDVVFNHTTLEHIFDVHKAFDNLVRLTKDVLILVVPYSQDQHKSTDYGDYWRFTPLGVIKNLENRGMRVLYCSVTPFKNAGCCSFTIATKNPDLWHERITPQISDGKTNLVQDKLLCQLIKLLKPRAG